MGPIMLDVEGMELTAEDKDVLDHPLVGGVILFTRNYHDRKQLNALTQDIRSAARGTILIAVDQEGGRVQRFRSEFTRIPPMGEVMPLAGSDMLNGKRIAQACGVVMAFELLAQNVDLSFAPVLDLCGVSEVIGDRSFSAKTEEVIALSTALMQGMKSVGMATTGKHFPGHGSVKADSHIAMPVDERSLEQIEATDMAVFKQVNLTGLLDAVMPAHVIYSQVDSHPAGFSRKWIKSVLREQIQFSGVVFSDDLSMQAATVAGDASDRAAAALSAGCDMALVCNSRSSAINVLDNLAPEFHLQSRARALLASHQFQPDKLTEQYSQAKNVLREIDGNEV